MELSEIVIGVLGLVVTGILGWLSFFIKKSMEDFKQCIANVKAENDEKNKEQDAEIKNIREEISNLKADMPLIYVTREDYIRTMNNIDNKLEKIYDATMKGGIANG